MLILTRNENQTFSIGDDIVIVVTRARHGQVKLCIQAPKGLAIIRDDAKKREKGG